MNRRSGSRSPTPRETMSREGLVLKVKRLEKRLTALGAPGETGEYAELSRLDAAEAASALLDAQRQLKESRDRYADLFDFAPVGYAALDDAGIVTELNLTAAAMIRGERRRLLGLPFHGFTTNRRAFIDCLAHVRGRPGVFQFDVTIRPRLGPEMPVRVAMKEYRSCEIGTPGFLLAVLDMTEQRRAAEDRRHAEEDRRRAAAEEAVARAASDAKDRFLAVLSHELRTPLTPILFALASLRDTGNVPDRLRPTLEMIGRNVALEARLIDDLLDVTRITQGKLRLAVETVDVHAVIEDVVALCAGDIRSAAVAVTLRLEAAERHVCGDATRLRQVVWNLLKNAVRSMPTEGAITVRSANDTPGLLRVTVTDNGAGILPDVLPRLFRPFEQDDARGRVAGLGLGLAISKGIVDALRGRIEARSAGAGGGATFTVELPTVPAPAATVTEPRRTALRAPAARRILLVEDNRDNAAAIAELLRACGYEVRVADSVATAVDKAAEGFDVLVSDIGLPDGTGRDVLRRLGVGAARAIALTGYGTDADVRKNADAGFARHLTKPVDPDQLLAAIDSLVAGGVDEAPQQRRSP